MCITLWLFNIAMENGPFIYDVPIKTSIYKGFSMAMLNNQRIIQIKKSECFRPASDVNAGFETHSLNVSSSYPPCLPNVHQVLSVNFASRSNMFKFPTTGSTGWCPQVM